jgi:hypothetical protein
MPQPRPYRAGESLEDFCRACKTDRLHTIIACDQNGKPIRVSCDYCGSQHNFRGGPRLDPPRPVPPRVDSPRLDTPRVDSPREARPVPTPRESRPVVTPRESRPVVTQPERSVVPVPPQDHGDEDLERLLRRIIREEAGLSPVTPAAKWRGGTLVLRPGTPGLQEKSWPIDTFFHKIIMLRNRLRTLEQQVNASDLPEDAKVKLQGYVSGCYGSLTSFNILFADDEDQFKGSGGD